MTTPMASAPKQLETKPKELTLFPKAEGVLRAIGTWGYPDRALHHTHRRFFKRHELIEAHSDGRVRVTARAVELLAKIGGDA